jgi:dihydroorotate dehydrogenase electron transfer subunit
MSEKPILTEAKIVELQPVAPSIFSLLLETEKKLPEPHPFQFVALHYGNYQLRRPFSVAGFKDNLLRLVFKVKGRMTAELSQARTGEKLSLIGPLGSVFDYGPYRRILTVAGGIGIAPFLYLFEKEATRFDFSLIYGVKTLDEAWYEEIYTDLKGFLLVTEDGSSNYPGYPVDYILAVSSYFKPEAVVAVGPEAMLRSLKAASLQLNVPFFVSVEPYMGCGLGACNSCLIQLTSGEFVRACEKGPIFELSKLFREDGY